MAAKKANCQALGDLRGRIKFIVSGAESNHAKHGQGFNDWIALWQYVCPHLRPTVNNVSLTTCSASALRAMSLSVIRAMSLSVKKTAQRFCDEEVLHAEIGPGPGLDFICLASWLRMCAAL